MILARALSIDPKTDADLTGYTDNSSVSPYARGYLAALIDAGIVQGSGSQLLPQNDITRAATAAILDRAIAAYANTPGASVSVPADASGIVLVTADDVTVSGRVDSLLVPAVWIDVTVTPSTDVDSIRITGDRSTVTLQKADVDSVSLDGAESKLILSGVDAGTVAVNGSGSTVQTSAGTTVESHTYTYQDNGSTHTATCSVCGAAETQAYTFGEWVVSGETRTHTCTACGKTETEELTHTHVWGEWTADGAVHTRTCTVCGAVETGEHHYNDWAGNGEGQHTHTCSDCGAVETVEHTCGAWEDAGDQHTRTCSVCGRTETAEHSYTGGVCTVCGADKNEAQIGDTKYETLADAFTAAREGDTVVLLKDLATTGIPGFYFSPELSNLTVDLNGHRIDGSSVIANAADPGTLNISLQVEESGGSISFINSSETAAEITGYLPLRIESSYGAPVVVTVAGNVTLTPTNGSSNCVDLDTAAYLLDTPDARQLFGNGGALATGTETEDAGASGSALNGAAISILAGRSGYGAMGTVSVTGGIFTVAYGVETVQAENFTERFITGGTFYGFDPRNAAEPHEEGEQVSYVAEGYTVTEDGGVYTVTAE